MSRTGLMVGAWALTALLVLFVLVSILTSDPKWIMWSCVPLLAGIGLFVSALRGETLGAVKIARDEQAADRKRTARRNESAAAPVDSAE